MFKNGNLAILFFTMVVVMLGFGIVIPILPFYVENFGAGGTELGMMMAIFSVMQFLFSPIWGDLSDRYGRKPILLIGVLGNAISMLLFAVAPNMTWMIVSRALAGILSSATLPTAMAFISDSTSERDRGGGMGMIGAAMGVGMIIGPGIGGWLGGDNLSLPFFFAAGLSTLAMILIFAILPESLQKENRTIRPGRVIRGPQFGVIWRALFGPVGFLLFLAFLVNFALANFEGIFGLYTKERYGYGPEQVGTIMTVVGVVSVIIQGVLTGPATRKLGEVKIILLSLIGSALGFAVMLFADSFPTVLMTVAFFVFTNAMLRPVIASLMSKMTTGGQGMALGLNNAYQSLGRVAGPLWAGALFDLHITWPYSSAAIIMLISFSLGLVFLRRGEVALAGRPEQPIAVAADD